MTKISFASELWGLQKGLRLAKHHDFDRVETETDSLAVVQALSKNAETTVEVDTLINDCKTLMHGFYAFEFKHIFREGNQCTDYFANMGQDSQWATNILRHPPEEIIQMLNRDANGIVVRRFY
ncbi:PREDICTED: uncharacterized protein LOC109147779 [Ipomoea nil]|uniref:uncharacterized protein LOC109147779 n=1 Tax=Ipomoea nil TaxID=35883 RepID=UPI0009010752|nr:PREDICTED: uncharacterized protein LOC109147779 [Ipomoea nil]